MEPLNRTDPVELGGIALRGRLGQGGMGVVYFGVTPDGEPVAVKTIRAEALRRPAARSRFEREIPFAGLATRRALLLRTDRAVRAGDIGAPSVGGGALQQCPGGQAIAVAPRCYGFASPADRAGLPSCQVS